MMELQQKYPDNFPIYLILVMQIRADCHAFPNISELSKLLTSLE